MNHESHNHCNYKNSTKRMALAASLHCLAGCMIGEMIWRYHRHARWICATYYGHFSVSLSFHLRLHRVNHTIVRAKLSLIKSLKLVFAADTLSILSMTVVDNIIMLIIPGAMDKKLSSSDLLG